MDARMYVCMYWDETTQYLHGVWARLIFLNISTAELEIWLERNGMDWKRSTHAQHTHIWRACIDGPIILLKKGWNF